MDYNIPKKQPIFLKTQKKKKRNDICINVFDIHVGPLNGANIDAKYVLDPYATSSYCIYYLAKLNKFIIQKMKIILYKHKQ